MTRPPYRPFKILTSPHATSAKAVKNPRGIHAIRDQAQFTKTSHGSSGNLLVAHIGFLHHPARSRSPMMKWTPADKRRRWFGLFFLLLAIGMLVWGQTLLKPHLHGFLYLVYWFVCFALTLMAMLTALLDMWVVRLRQRRSENEAARETLRGQTKPNEETQTRL